MIRPLALAILAAVTFSAASAQACSGQMIAPSDHGAPPPFAYPEFDPTTTQHPLVSEPKPLAYPENAPDSLAPES